MTSYGVVDATHALVRVYLPTHHWQYLLWLKSQGLDFDRFTRACDKRRRALEADHVSLADFLEVVTERIAKLHYCPHPDRSRVVQPVFPSQIEAALDKADAYFRKSGPDATRWHGWNGSHKN